MFNVKFDFTIDTVMVVIALNIILMALKTIFFYLHERYKYVWSGKALSAVSFLLSMISVVAANLPHPPTRPEFPDPTAPPNPSVPPSKNGGGSGSY